MAVSKRTVLITGCSDGGTGAELAKQFHKAGLRVYATARDVSKMESLTALGIETLPLDIQSESSIEECAKKVSHLDMLINNAGATYGEFQVEHVVECSSVKTPMRSHHERDGEQRLRCDTVLYQSHIMLILLQ